MKKSKCCSLGFIAFLQALGLVAYCSLVAFVIWNGQRWFGKMPNFFAPFLFLILFTTSALISGIVTLSYPFILWQNKQTEKAIRLILYTTAWLLTFTALILLFLFYSR